MRPVLEIRLAWRNVWRNPRRTSLTVAATVFAVFLTVVFVGMADGTHGKLIEDSVRVQSGHVTIAAEGYLEEHTLEHAVELDPALVAALDSVPGVAGWTPRISSFALASRDDSSQGIAVVGVDPEREGQVSTLPDRIVEGRFLSPQRTREVLLGRRLARSLGAEVGDEVLLYGIAYSLENAYELFTVSGLIGLPEPSLERRLALISLQDAAEFYVYDDKVSEVAVLADGSEQSEALRTALRRELSERGAAGAVSEDGKPAQLRVYTWREVLPELDQYIVLDRAGMIMMLVILVVVVGFGILNTILMSVLERTRELGVMLALGASPGSVFRIVFLESLFLAAVGLALGLALSVPVVAWLVNHPIPLPGEWDAVVELIGAEPVVVFALKASNPLNSAAVILVVALLAALYPALKAARGRPVDALRSL
jgi:ABC-type lipoprotein release transport system permease subunit